MVRKKLLGLCLVAVFAITGMAASGAAASEFPSYFECVKAPGGKFEKGCTKEGGKGGYVIKEGIGKGKIWKTKGGLIFLHVVVPGKGDIKLECLKWKDVKRIIIIGGRGYDFEVRWFWSGCKALGAPCFSPGAKKGEVRSLVLASYLGWINKGGKILGDKLYNEASPGSGNLLEFECIGLTKARVHGGVIGQVTGDVGTFSKTTTDTYSVGPFLGEVAPGYTPLVNTPAFEGESASILLTEFNGAETGNTWQPEGGLPSGLEGVDESKGDELAVF
jgi:hypothetical protein